MDSEDRNKYNANFFEESKYYNSNQNDTDNKLDNKNHDNANIIKNDQKENANVEFGKERRFDDPRKDNPSKMQVDFGDEDLFNSRNKMKNLK